MKTTTKKVCVVKKTTLRTKQKGHLRCAREGTSRGWQNVLEEVPHQRGEVTARRAIRGWSRDPV